MPEMTTEQKSKKNGVPQKRSLAAESAPHRPSRPLLGMLPIARVIPMDVHSVADYVTGTVGVSSMFVANTWRAKLAGALLGSTQLTASLLTDYKLSAAKVLPIEVHEILDYVYGFSLMAAPFALMYITEDPIVSWIQIGTGLGVVLASLLTDYKAETGIGAKMGRMLEAPEMA